MKTMMPMMNVHMAWWIVIMADNKMQVRVHYFLFPLDESFQVFVVYGGTEITESGGWLQNKYLWRSPRTRIIEIL